MPPAHQHTSPGTTRLAPSPTGALHLGNARTFLVNWAIARARGWRILLRIEDLDTPRNKPGAVEQAIDLLTWLGIDWDIGPVIQSADMDPHRAAMARLASLGLAYPCALTRSQIEAAASAPQEGAHEVRFPPELRPPIEPRTFDNERTNWRFVTPDHAVRFDDEFAGPREYRPFDTIGDFVIWTARGQPAYQLAVVVDDARQGVTHVVRGDDLLESTARQILLYQSLALCPPPRYCHLPLVVGPDGRRLAKRHGDTRLDRYRAAGVPRERIVGLCAHWCGMTAARRHMPTDEFRRRLDLGTIPKVPIVFTQEDEAWLLGSN